MSDHTIVAATISKKLVREDTLPIPSEFFEHPLYTKVLEYFYWKENLVRKEGVDKLNRVKVLIRGAAETVREHLQRCEPDLPVIKAQTSNTIARCVWTQDWRLAEAMIKRDPEEVYIVEL